jgi:hypothetical protein
VEVGSGEEEEEEEGKCGGDLGQGEEVETREEASEKAQVVLGVR